jgi:hypothetical protein
LGSLRVLLEQGVIAVHTLVANQGDSRWLTVGERLGVPPQKTSVWLGATSDAPIYRSFEQFALLMAMTLTFYMVYLIPANTRDLKAITGRSRMEFLPLLILGIASFGILLLVMLTLWAFDLERHGRNLGTPGRQESLGTYVLILNVLAVLIGCFAGGLALLLSAALGAAAVWLLEKEINLYARTRSI